LRLCGRRAGVAFREQHGCSNEKTCTALAGTVTMAADALAIRMSTHVRFTSRSDTALKLARLTATVREENRRRN
jgi:hypothetical protein